VAATTDEAIGVQHHPGGQPFRRRRTNKVVSGEEFAVATLAAVALHWKRRFWHCPSIYGTGIVDM
jgi:hypothetical protein